MRPAAEVAADVNGDLTWWFHFLKVYIVPKVSSKSGTRTEVLLRVLTS